MGVSAGGRSSEVVKYERKMLQDWIFWQTCLALFFVYFGVVVIQPMRVGGRGGVRGEDRFRKQCESGHFFDSTSRNINYVDVVDATSHV